jgi:hypothetical protein
MHAVARLLHDALCQNSILPNPAIAELVLPLLSQTGPLSGQAAPVVA